MKHRLGRLDPSVVLRRGFARRANSPAWQLVGPGACGLDEVGRGALFSPLVAAAVPLQESLSHHSLRSSARRWNL